MEKFLKNPTLGYPDGPGFYVTRSTFSSIVRSNKFDPNIGEILGCGDWGCVYSTEDRDVVAKITLDPTEIEFVNLVLNEDIEYKKGLVKYYKSYSIFPPMNSFPVYVFMKENVINIGRIGKQVDELLYQYNQCVVTLYGYLRRNSKFWIESKNLFDFSMSNINKIYKHNSTLHWIIFNTEELLNRELSGAEAVAMLSRACELSAKEMKYDKDLKLIGEALFEWSLDGIFFADLHINNIGQTERGWVINDPGGSLIL